MTFSSLLTLLRHKLGILFLGGVLCAAVAFGALISVQPPYSSSMDFLLVQGNTSGQDFYTAFKSSEYLGKVLTQAMYSERFITEVIATGKMNERFLPINKKDRLDEWAKLLTVRNNLELGIMSVSVKGKSDRDTARIMEGVATVLTEKNALFRSGDEKSVEIRVLSGPILEMQPAFKKLMAVVIGGFFSGIFLASFFVIVRGSKSHL